MLSIQKKLSNGCRAGLTLVEVLVSMGIMTIGLLGVASLFPVGGHYMQQGEVADTANAIAQAALDDAIIRGHLNPENWVVHDAYSASSGRFSEFLTGEGLSGQGIPFNGTGLKDSLSLVTAKVFNLDKFGTQVRPAIHGDAFVIDPLGITSILKDDSLGNLLTTRGDYSMPMRSFPGISSFIPSSTKWSPWFANGGMWSVRRITLAPTTQWLNHSELYQYQQPAARALFTANDDLSLSLPDDSDSPARQRLETWQNTSNGNAIQPASRQSGGNYSWIISVSPGSSEARDALATQPDAHPYDVSVVVFHKRVLGEGYDGALEAERLVTAKVVTTGTAGGELLLERRATESSDPYTNFPSPFEELRSGQYVMLTGPHPLSTNNRPMLFNQWYKVQSIEDSGSSTINGSDDEIVLDREEKVLVSLRGPDWPWQPAGDLSDTNDNELLPNDLRVTIVPGAVAVHTKTMRLESGSSWGE